MTNLRQLIDSGTLEDPGPCEHGYPAGDPCPYCHIKQLEKDLMQEIANRDNWEEKATELANAVGEFLNIDVGEHSSANCPVVTALTALNEKQPPPIEEMLGRLPQLLLVARNDHAPNDDRWRIYNTAKKEYVKPGFPTVRELLTHALSEIDRERREWKSI